MDVRVLGDADQDEVGRMTHIMSRDLYDAAGLRVSKDKGNVRYKYAYLKLHDGSLDVAARAWRKMPLTRRPSWFEESSV